MLANVTSFVCSLACFAVQGLENDTSKTRQAPKISADSLENKVTYSYTAFKSMGLFCCFHISCSRASSTFR